MTPSDDQANLRSQIEQLQQRLEDAEQTLAAIRRGEVDALVVETPAGKQIYTLQGADEPYRIMVERMREGAATLTRDGTILYCNQHMADLLRRPLEKVIGSDMRLYLGEQGDRFADMLAAACDVDQRQEFDLRRSKGEQVAVQLSLSMMTVDEQLRFCAVVTDLTEQRQHQRVQESESHFRHIAQAMPQIVWIAGPDGLSEFINNRWSQYTGLSNGQSRGDGWLQAVHPDDVQETVERWRQAIDTGSGYEVEHRLRCRDGLYRWHLSRGIPVHEENGQITKWLGTTTDIESQKQAEASLKNLAATLEQRVVERTALAEQRAVQLRQAASELAQAEQRERRRISQTLHDHLQQLLVAAKFKVSMSFNGIDKSDKVRNWLEEVDKLLGDAVEASRDLSIDLSPPVLHERGLTDALHWLGHRIGNQHNLAVEVQVDTTPERDQRLASPLRDFIFHTARELLFNAVKHAHGSRVMMTMDFNEEGEIELAIVDDGVGCSSDDIEAAEGTGLSSIRHRAQLWGGTLELRAEPGQGCRAQLRLTAPADYAQQPQPQERQPPVRHIVKQRPPQKSPSGIRVLIADDHAILREGLVGLLHQHGFEVIGEAEDGQQAIDLAAALQPQVILMDISMPHVNGIDATRIICERSPDTRVIGLSMLDDANVAVAMRSAGAVGFLTKGSPSDLLVETIRSSIDASPCSKTP